MKLVLLGILAPIWIPALVGMTAMAAVAMSLVVSAAFVCLVFREFARGYL